ncbi:hypothetical protein [Streptomyces sp. NPDC007905]
MAAPPAGGGGALWVGDGAGAVPAVTRYLPVLGRLAARAHP